MELHLPPLSIFAAKSFYLLIAAIAALVAPRFGVDLGPPEALANRLYDVAAAVLAVLAYRERLAPGRRLVIKGPLK